MHTTCSPYRSFIRRRPFSSTPQAVQAVGEGEGMKNRDGLENNNHWETPEWLYQKLDAEFKFDFDPCPLHADFDGLSIEWKSSNYVNPPYDRFTKPKFIQKAFEQWNLGKTCVLLLPAATGTKQFHEIILPYAEIRFLKGRVAFKGFNTKGEYSTKNKGKSDSMVVIFKPEWLKLGEEK